jgi:regulator of sigma E protease
MKRKFNAESVAWFIALLVAVVAAAIFYPKRLQGFLYTAIPFIVILGILVFIHELGHYWAARRAGMRVHEFAIGMGPILWTTLRHHAVPGLPEGEETRYSLRAVPLGGFVRIAGMDPGEDPDAPGSFERQSWGWRFITLLAGCVMNFALAAFLFMIVGITAGIGVTNNQVQLAVANRPAALAGIKQGDRIVGIGTVRTTDVERLRREIENHPGQSLQFTVERQGKTLQVPITPALDKDEFGNNVGRIGISFGNSLKKVGPMEALIDGGTKTWQMVVQIYKTLAGLLTGRRGSADIGGPVAIIQQTGEVAQYAAKSGEFASLFMFAAMLSVNLGFINLLPIPALDGGRLFVLILEGILRIRFDPKKVAYVHAIGMIFLLMLIVLVTFRDIRHIFGI